MITRFLVVGFAALTLARPEVYKENEEFNYARSSTDEGSKSGFYEAQRGNVGGNYERAHNMDHLAQGQMSDLVHQTGSQVDPATDANQGNLYGAGYTRGVYGRHYDTSNIGNRNFQENTGHSSSSSSLNSQYGQYQSGGTHGSLTDNGGSLQQGMYGQGSSRSSYGTGSEYGRTGYGSSQQLSSTGYQQYSGTNQRATSNLDSVDQTYQKTGQIATPYRIVPVRIVLRPMVPVKIPVQAQANDQFVESGYNQRNEQHSQSHAQNALIQRELLLNTGANTEDLNTAGLGKEKHYESSFNYHKEWEKHSEVTPVPLSIPTSNPLSESLYNQQQQSLGFDQQEQYQLNHQHSSQRAVADSSFVNTNHELGLNTLQSDTNEKKYGSGYIYKKQSIDVPNSNRYVVLAPSANLGTELNHGTYGAGQSQQAYGSQSQHTSNYRAGSQSESQRAYAAQALDQSLHRTNQDNLALNHNRAALLAATTNNGQQATDAHGSEPKNYESSYSYKKSWERQGDPYIIRPAGPVSGQPERLLAHGSHASGHHSHGQQEDCDETQRHIRSASYYDEQLSQQDEYIGQQVEDMGQQVQTAWDSSDGPHIDQLGQQVENTWGQVDLDQQLETKWDTQKQEEMSQVHTLLQQSQNLQAENLNNEHDLRQPLASLEPQKRESSSNTEDIDQHTMGVEYLGQQVEQSWAPNYSHDLEQQVVNSWSTNQREDSSNTEDLGQQIQQSWEPNHPSVQDLGPQLQNGLENSANVEHRSDATEHAYSEWQHRYNQYIEHNIRQIEQATGDMQQHAQNNWSPSAQQPINNPDYVQDIEQHGNAHATIETTLAQSNYNQGPYNKPQHWGNNNEQPIKIETENKENKDINGNKEIRGDLGTPKDKTAEFDKNLKEILSDVYKFHDDRSGKDINNDGFVGVPTVMKEKTPEELESLSLVKDVEGKITNKLSSHQERDIQISHIPIVQDYRLSITNQEEQQKVNSENNNSWTASVGPAKDLPSIDINHESEPKEPTHHEDLDQDIEDLGQEPINFDRNSDIGQELEGLNTNWGQSEHDLNSFNMGQQHLENFGQQVEDLGETLQSKRLYDVDKLSVIQNDMANPSAPFGQTLEVSDRNPEDYVTNKNIKKIEHNSDQFSDLRLNNAKDDIPLVIEGRASDVEVKDRVADTKLVQHIETMEEQSLIPPEHVDISEEPSNQGFWKKVGNKFSSAKDTVSSWFKKS